MYMYICMVDGSLWLRLRGLIFYCVIPGLLAVIVAFYEDIIQIVFGSEVVTSSLSSLCPYLISHQSNEPARSYTTANRSMYSSNTVHIPIWDELVPLNDFLSLQLPSMDNNNSKGYYVTMNYSVITESTATPPLQFIYPLHEETASVAQKIPIIICLLGFSFDVSFGSDHFYGPNRSYHNLTTRVVSDATGALAMGIIPHNESHAQDLIRETVSAYNSTQPQPQPHLTTTRRYIKNLRMWLHFMFNKYKQIGFCHQSRDDYDLLTNRIGAAIMMTEDRESVPYVDPVIQYHIETGVLKACSHDQQGTSHIFYCEGGETNVMMPRVIRLYGEFKCMCLPITHAGGQDSDESSSAMLSRDEQYIILYEVFDLPVTTTGAGVTIHRGSLPLDHQGKNPICQRITHNHRQRIECYL